MFASTPNFPARPRGARSERRIAGAGALRRLVRRARLDPRPGRPRVSAVVVEEEAASLLYGERSGMVHASPVGPPLADEPPHARARERAS